MYCVDKGNPWKIIHPVCQPTEKLEASLIDWLELAHEWFLLPQDIYYLVGPISSLRADLNVKVVEDIGSDDAHFMVCHTRSQCVSKVPMLSFES